MKKALLAFVCAFLLAGILAARANAWLDIDAQVVCSEESDDPNDVEMAE